jgi:DNA-binding MarR family transcriptional regulator
MFKGTRKENMLDAKAKGRTTFGEKDAMHKLTEKQVLDIREKWATGNFWNAELAKLFGVSKANISMIVKRNRWTYC